MGLFLAWKLNILIAKSLNWAAFLIVKISLIEMLCMRDYLVSVLKVRVLFRMFDFEACKIAKIKKFTIVNDCFCNERNEKIGLYRQTLFMHEFKEIRINNKVNSVKL
jgi:hypothetical protein